MIPWYVHVLSLVHFWCYCADLVFIRQMSFVYCRHDDKTAVLLHLLLDVIKPTQQTVVFVATKHHVEYLNMVR